MFGAQVRVREPCAGAAPRQRRRRQVPGVHAERFRKTLRCRPPRCGVRPDGAARVLQLPLRRLLRVQGHDHRRPLPGGQDLPRAPLHRLRGCVGGGAGEARADGAQGDGAEPRHQRQERLHRHRRGGLAVEAGGPGGGAGVRGGAGRRRRRRGSRRRHGRLARPRAACAGGGVRRGGGKEDRGPRAAAGAERRGRQWRRSTRGRCTRGRWWQQQPEGAPPCREKGAGEGE
mmetsp:Transcript_29114/g.59640  ORF Transcript_29114/g.59640 Transcript_29114/m.59640 type:complete len:230 (+) Transcript_29114:415-1104(+)